mgnify:FL=1
MATLSTLSVNEKGHLTIGGLDTVELVKKHGSPLYVMDENVIRQNCADFRDAIEKYYDGNGLCIYASKAFCCKEMCRIIDDEKCGLDVVSGGEIYTARAAGFPMERVFFHGNNKSREELELALDSGVGRIIVDNISELELLNSLCVSMNKRASIYMRIKPGIDAHTHSFIRTGQIDSKFGFALETGEALDAVKKAVSYGNIDLVGFHCHIGSQIFELEPFTAAADVMIGFIALAEKECGVKICELDLGGGFGIRYTDEDKPRAYTEFIDSASAAVKAACKAHGVAMPKIMIEPGRSIVGPAGITLYTVGAVKHIPNIRTYVSIDGGMGDNPRYILYSSKYDLIVANKADLPKTETITLAGKCCESGDLIQENALTQPVEVGDIMAVTATGAYNYSMASNYNRIPRLPVVMVKDGVDRTIIRRETYEDLIRLDV